MGRFWIRLGHCSYINLLISLWASDRFVYSCASLLISSLGFLRGISYVDFIQSILSIIKDLICQALWSVLTHTLLCCCRWRVTASCSANEREVKVPINIVSGRMKLYYPIHHIEHLFPLLLFLDFGTQIQIFSVINPDGIKSTWSISFVFVAVAVAVVCEVLGGGFHWRTTLISLVFCSEKVGFRLTFWNLKDIFPPGNFGHTCPAVTR